MIDSQEENLRPKGNPATSKTSSLLDSISFLEHDRPSDNQIAAALSYRTLIEIPSEEKRGLFSSSGKLLLESPNPHLIKALTDDPRIEYFPYQIPESVKPHLPIDNETADYFLKNEESMFADFVGNFLASHIKETFKGNLPVSVRGIACSINGGFYSDGMLIRDIRQVMELGDEQERDSTLITGIGENTEKLHYRSNQYLVSGVESLVTVIKNPENRAKIFPVLLVYDKTKLSNVRGYSADLPKNQQERAGAILKAYILDKPSQV